MRPELRMLVTWMYVLHENSLSCTHICAIRATSIKRKETNGGQGGDEQEEGWVGRRAVEKENLIKKEKGKTNRGPDVLKG